MMKIRNLIFALAAVMIFASCEKDDDNNLPKNSHRLIRAYEEQGSTYYLDSLTYDGEKLTGIQYYQKNGGGEWYKKYKTEISYNGNHVTSIQYYDGSSVLEPFMKSEYIIESGLVKEEIRSYYNTDWYVAWKYAYQYSDNKMNAWQVYEADENENLIMDGKCDFSYQNGKLYENIEYSLNENDEWIPETKYTFSWDEAKLMNWIEYKKDEPNNWTYYIKNEFTYTGDQITESDNYSWISDWTLARSMTYTYNENGYLYEIIHNQSYTCYEYEEGNGNAILFYYYPENLVRGEPTIKSAGTNQNKTYIPYYKRIFNMPQF